MNTHKHKKNITICHGKSCRVFGARQLKEDLIEKTKNRNDIEICTSGCMGYCATSFNATVDDTLLKDTHVDYIIKHIE